MLELRLMDWRGEFTKSVEVKENDLIIISIISGDWLLISPVEVDASTTRRCVSFYDGMVRFLATQENIDKINAMTDTYELLKVFGNKKEIETGEA